MPTSRTALAVILLAAGCGASPPGAGPGAVTRLGDRGIAVAGPPGFCIDRPRTREAPGEAVVFLADCAALAGGAPGPGGDALLSATVASVQVAATLDPVELERLLLSDAGRAALARGGQGEAVRIVETRRAGEVLLLQLDDARAPAADPPAHPRQWRAVFAVEGRMVTATVRTPPQRPLGSDEGFGVLAVFVERLRAANLPAAPGRT
jgi:hypothetical protein